MKYIKKFEELRLKDVPQVGGKNASLGEMINQLKPKGILIPTGFAVTSQAYWDLLAENKLVDKLKAILSQLTDVHDVAMLSKVGKQARDLITQAQFSPELNKEIVEAYHTLCDVYKKQNLDVAIRSSATAEDLPTASFAGQQDSFLNVCGDEEVLTYVKECMASLFTDRSIVYRVNKGFDHFKVGISVGVQKMIRSDLASSGVAFSLDTESGFKDIVTITSSYGLGESIVQGIVVPDEFIVFKSTLEKYKPIVRKKCGSKLTKYVYADKQTKQIDVPVAERGHFSLTDEEILHLTRWVVLIEQHYSDLAGRWQPMDIEWAKDGNDNKIYIIQARPETVHAPHKNGKELVRYTMQNITIPELKKHILTTGESIGQKIAHGKARIVESAEHMNEVQLGDVLITHMTDPDWVPIMKRASGIVTTSGGRTCHAAIVSRELGIPAIVGVQDAMSVIKQGQDITIDCSLGKKGYVYDGNIPFNIENVVISKLPPPAVPILINLGDPDQAYALSFLPVSGVGLARLEFIITNVIQIHPLALTHPDKVQDAKVLERIKEIAQAYPSLESFYVESLAQGIATIACAFYPRTVYVRLPDFKSNEYSKLLGGQYFEIQEANPMMGLRGASRYYHDTYKEAFALDCAAIKKARDEMGLTNISVLVPFVRTPEEGEQVLEQMKHNGLQRNGNQLKILMMCEVPSDVLMMNEFSQLFDGFSIGTNDLTQFTLSVDRDSEIVASLFNERSEAEKRMIELAIVGAHRNNKYIGVCGQAPSDYPDIAEFLICLGIDSISLNPDVVIPFLMKNIKCRTGAVRSAGTKVI